MPTHQRPKPAPTPFIAPPDIPDDLTPLRNARLLAQPRERVELTQNCDDRTTLSGLAHHGRRQAAAIGRDAKALGLKHPLVFGDRLEYAFGGLITTC